MNHDHSFSSLANWPAEVSSFPGSFVWRKSFAWTEVLKRFDHSLDYKKSGLSLPWIHGLWRLPHWVCLGPQWRRRQQKLWFTCEFWELWTILQYRKLFFLFKHPKLRYPKKFDGKSLARQILTLDVWRLFLPRKVPNALREAEDLTEAQLQLAKKLKAEANFRSRCCGLNSLLSV